MDAKHALSLLMLMAELYEAIQAGGGGPQPQPDPEPIPDPEPMPEPVQANGVGALR